VARKPGFLAGVRTFGRSLRLLRAHSELWPWCALPLLVNFAAFGLAAWVFLLNVDELSGLFREAIAIADPSRWYEWLWVGPLRAIGWLAKWILLILFAAAVYVLFTLVGGVVASPFLEVLSQRLERIVTGTVDEEGAAGVRAVLASAGRAVREEAKRVAFFLAVQACFFALVLVPGLQPFVVAANLVFAALFVALDYTGYVLDRRAIRFRQRRTWIWENRRAMFGFGGAALGTFLIPGLNFLCLPWLVAAGTLLALEVDPPVSARAGEV
jgi:CysZ protein